MEQWERDDLYKIDQRRVRDADYAWSQEKQRREAQPREGVGGLLAGGPLALIGLLLLFVAGLFIYAALTAFIATIFAAGLYFHGANYFRHPISRRSWEAKACYALFIASLAALGALIWFRASWLQTLRTTQDLSLPLALLLGVPLGLAVVVLVVGTLKTSSAYGVGTVLAHQFEVAVDTFTRARNFSHDASDTIYAKVEPVDFFGLAKLWFFVFRWVALLCISGLVFLAAFMVVLEATWLLGVLAPLVLFLLLRQPGSAVKGSGDRTTRARIWQASLAGAVLLSLAALAALPR